MPMSESVLLVDDDPDILRTVGEFLEHSAYTVFREATGEAAVILLTGHGDVPTVVRAMQLGAEHAMIKDYGLEG